MRIWKTHELLSITFEGRTAVGRVMLASPNGVSLMLQFDGTLGGYVGAMPAMWDPNECTFRDLLSGKPVTLSEPALR